MLKALVGFPRSSINVKIPRLLMFDPETHTQVLEDYRHIVDLLSLLREWSAVDDMSLKQHAASLGRSLGMWLRSFHSWSSAPKQADLRKAMKGNQAMRELKDRISYSRIIGILEAFPALQEGSRDKLEGVVKMGSHEFQHPAAHAVDESWGLIHGDFWSGK